MSSTPGAHDFDVMGPKWIDSFTFGDSTDGINITTPLNLTGYTVTMRVKFAAGTQSFTLTGTSLGVVSWNITISTWAVGPVAYDICATAPDGTPTWMLAGTVRVTQ